MAKFTEKYNSLEKVLSFWEANIPSNIVFLTAENKEIISLLA